MGKRYKVCEGCRQKTETRDIVRVGNYEYCHDCFTNKQLAAYRAGEHS